MQSPLRSDDAADAFQRHVPELRREGGERSVQATSERPEEEILERAMLLEGAAHSEPEHRDVRREIEAVDEAVQMTPQVFDLEPADELRRRAAHLRVQPFEL